MKCTFCSSEKTHVKKHHHTYTIKNEIIEFEADRRFCSECNQLIYDSELDNNAGKQAISIYNKRVGIPSEDIIKLRKSYNMSLQQFSKVIGCAKKTLISYEAGTSIPNDIYMITLKTLMDNPEIILDMIDSNKERFSEAEYTTITNKINNAKLNLNIVFDNKPSIYNGFTKFIPEKVINLILMLSEKGILKTKLLKEMFYCDFYAYKTLGASITGLEYAKLPYGPVPESFDFILNNLTNSNIINYDVEYDNNYEAHMITKNQEIDTTIFTKEENDIINKIIKYFENFNTSQIVDYSHKEKAFTDTEKLEKISYDFAFDINLEV